MKDLPKEGQKKSHGSVIEPYKDGMWQGWASFCHLTFQCFSFMCCNEVLSRKKFANIGQNNNSNSSSPIAM